MNITNVVMGNMFSWDQPDFCDAYIVSADIDGRPATETQLDEMMKNSSLVHELAHKNW